MADTPEGYGYSQRTLDRPMAAARDDARAVFAKTMFLVAVTAGFAAAGAYVGRNLSWGVALLCWIGSIGLVIAMSVARRKEEVTRLQMGLLFGVGALLGIAIGPTLQRYATLEGGSTIIAQAAGLTALFMALMGAIGYLSRRDLSGLGRISFIGLIVLILFGLVGIFVNIPNQNLIWCVGGLVVFAGLTTFDFWRLRRAGEGDVALIALSIFLDAFNVFLFMLQLLGGGRD